MISVMIIKFKDEEKIFDTNQGFNTNTRDQNVANRTCAQLPD